jgi:flagellar hook-associated protein 2
VTSSLVAAGIGVSAGITSSSGSSNLTLTSQTAGAASGGLTISSSIAATSDTPLSYTGSTATSLENSTGTFTSIPSENDALSGSISIQVGTNAAQIISVPPNSATSPSNNLSGLAGAINKANIGFTATAMENSDGTWSLSLWSNTSGSAGNLTVTSSILDTTNTSTSTLRYTNSSDINSLTSLGISVNNDGSLSLDVASLDSVLNLDFSSVVGFFQNSNSWGQTFNTMLTDAGSSSATGILSLASSSNSNIESTLNADISREESQISAEQKSLTTELNTANQVMQSIPSQLDQVNELYSAITGYNQQTNG